MVRTNLSAWAFRLGVGTDEAISGNACSELVSPLLRSPIRKTPGSRQQWNLSAFSLGGRTCQCPLKIPQFPPVEYSPGAK
jgi:hypothetical protein